MSSPLLRPDIGSSAHHDNEYRRTLLVFQQRCSSAEQVVCKSGFVASNDNKDDAEVIIRALRKEVERLKEEIARLRRDHDERPPHYL
jgi:hypothetical protein